MSNTISRHALVILYCAAIIIAPSARADDAVVARDAWLRQPPASLNDAAVFVVIENHTAQKRTIISGSTDIAGKVELHEMKMDHMMMKMTPVEKVEIPAKGKVSFDPNKLHIMLFGLKRRPMIGEMVTVTLMLDDGTSVPITATVRKN